MGKLFGTDGVRGIANSELTPELAYKLGRAGAYVLTKEKHRPKIVIAKDTRISGDLLGAALEAGILSVGADVLDIGIMPTPAAAYLTQYYKADAGVVISASHNPYEYNGIKFFNDKGYKLDDAIEEEIEDIILNDKELESTPTGKDLGKKISTSDALEQYTAFLASTIDHSLKDLKVVIDCANGASYKVAKKVLTALDATVYSIHDEPDGININVQCGSTHPEDLTKEVVKRQADIGLAFDGDADRLIAVDEKGNVIDGDVIIYICSKMLKQQNKLKNNLVTATVMSNIGFYKALENIGCDVETTKVGDRYVLERMLEKDSIIGGEQSGHIIFLEHTTTGDGVLSGLQLLQALKLSEQKLSELSSEVTIYPQILINAKVKNENKHSYDEDATIINAIEILEKKMAYEGRVLIRPSGTEPLVRVMIEGKDQTEIQTLAKELAAIIEERLG